MRIKTDFPLSNTKNEAECVYFGGSEIPVCPQNLGNFCVDLQLNYPEVLSHTQRLPLFESTGYCQDNIRKREYKIRSKFSFIIIYLNVLF